MEYEQSLEASRDQMRRIEQYSSTDHTSSSDDEDQETNRGDQQTINASVDDGQASRASAGEQMTYAQRRAIYNQDVEALKKKYETPSNIWIVKPGANSNRGYGITVCHSLNEIRRLVR